MKKIIGYILKTLFVLALVVFTVLYLINYVSHPYSDDQDTDSDNVIDPEVIKEVVDMFDSFNSPDRAIADVEVFFYEGSDESDRKEATKGIEYIAEWYEQLRQRVVHLEDYIED